MNQEDLEKILKTCTTYDGSMSKGQHNEFLGWLENKIYQYFGFDVDLGSQDKPVNYWTKKIGYTNKPKSFNLK